MPKKLMSSLKKMPGRPATIDMPRETILAHSSRLFAETGYERTSLNDVARSVGLSKAAVYHYFPTKQAIYEAIVANLLRRLHDHVAAAVAQADGHGARLRAFMLAHAAYFEAHHTEFVTLLHGVSGIGTAQTDPQRAVRDGYESLLRRLLTEGVADGAFVTRDVNVTALAILSMLNWMSRWFDPKGARRATDFAQDYFENCHNGLAPR